jgi:hypothetical protein
VEIDTSCLVGNAPGWPRITGVDEAGGGEVRLVGGFVTHQLHAEGR